ncbi:MAG: division/cell wall cluster transcriptional repressor MraZ [Bacilli bacterium]|nr:division/cell wall cluster transcriptional repressor MraZ [Bacilli bacterium]
MLMGEYHNNIDLKGRVVIPSKFRDLLGEKIVLTRGLDSSLFVYPYETFLNLTKELNTLPFTEKESRNFIRFMLSGATTLEFDKQGRIIIPSFLKEYASLQKEVVLVGVLNRVEIWSKDNWNNFMDLNFRDLSEISVNLFNSN